MKRTAPTKSEIQTLKQRMVALTELSGAVTQRFELLTQLGYAYDGDRDVYKALGYKEVLEFHDYYTQYRRQDIAKAIIDRPVKDTWLGDITLLESDDDQETELEKKWKELSKDLKLKSKFSRVDKLTGLGKYGVLFMGVSDVNNVDEFVKPVQKSKANKLLYVKPVSEKNATIDKYIDDVQNPLYGYPEYYTLNIAKVNSNETKSVKVHHTRVIHIVEETLENEIEGIPRLEAVFNRLKDLEKLVGGSAEMFWRGARPGYQTEVDKDYQMTPAVYNDLKEQLDEYEHNMRRFLRTEGVNIKALQAQVEDPTNHVDIQIQMISAVTGIPKRILTGSERGELASTQDKGSYLSLITSRREEFAEPMIIGQFVDWCVEYGILPEPKDEYTVQWPELFSLSDKEKAEIGKIKAAALKDYVSEISAQAILPVESFFRIVMGLSEEEIELIMEQVDAQVNEEEEIMRRVEEQMQQQTQPGQNGQVQEDDNGELIEENNINQN